MHVVFSLCRSRVHAQTEFETLKLTNTAMNELLTDLEMQLQTVNLFCYESLIARLNMISFVALQTVTLVHGNCVCSNVDRLVYSRANKADNCNRVCYCFLVWFLFCVLCYFLY